MFSTKTSNLPESSGSLTTLQILRGRTSLGIEELSIRPQKPSSRSLIQYSQASSLRHDSLQQENVTNPLTIGIRKTELHDRQLSLEDNEYPSATDFHSVVTVNDFGFASSWSRQVQKYAVDEGWTKSIVDLGREEQEQGEQSSSEKLPLLTFDDLRSFEDQFPPTSLTQSPTIQALSLDLGGTLDHRSRPNPTVDLQHELLSESRVSQKEFGESKFIPHDKLCTILNDYNVFRLLKHLFPLDLSTQLRDKAAEICSREHHASRRMILAILVIIGQPSYIDDFISHEIYDIDLPLRESREHTSHDNKQSKKNSFQKRQDEDISEPHAFFEHWHRKQMIDFLQWQYVVLSPFLELGGDRVCFYDMEEKITLPFIEYHEPEKTRVGAEGAVWKVKIHPAHHNFVGSEGDENPSFAVKAMFSEEYKHIRDEVRILERFSGSQPGHEHLIRLLLLFKHGRKYYMVFRWAAGNLADYWKLHPSPTPTVHRTRWLFEQCHGIADALKKIHYHLSWPLKHPITGHDEGELLSEDSGWHGDVKPENLLLFDDDDRRIVITDFGLTVMYSARKVSSPFTPKSLRGFSRTYRPPEFSLEAPVSQKCDVWSLGCVYLEFITWYLLGYEKTRGSGANSFTMRRVEDDDRSSHIQEDKFFNMKLNTTQGGDGTEYIVDVKNSVKKWITDLRMLEHCSAAIGAFLDMIETDMLVPDTHARVDMNHVQRIMSRFVEMCQLSDEYCTVHTYAAPVRTETGAQLAIGELDHSAVIRAPLGFERLKRLNSQGPYDLNTFISFDKQLHDLGLQETSDHGNATSIGNTGMPEKQKLTLESILPETSAGEKTDVDSESSIPGEDMASSFTTSLSTTARSSYEKSRNQQHLTSRSSGTITKAVRDDRTPMSMRKVLPKMPDIEVRVVGEITRALLGHQDFKSLCTTAVNEFSAKESRERIHGLIRVYGQRLDAEAASLLQHQASQFVQEAAGRISDELNLSILRSEEVEKLESTSEEEPDLEKWLAIVWERESEQAAPQPAADNHDPDDTFLHVDAVKDFLLSSQAFETLLQAFDDWTNLKRRPSLPARPKVSPTSESQETATFKELDAHSHKLLADDLSESTSQNIEKSITGDCVIDPALRPRSRTEKLRSSFWRIFDFMAITFSFHSLVDTFSSSPPAGYERVRWRCTCNTMLWGDFPTDDSHALMQLKEELLGNLSLAPNSSRSECSGSATMEHPPEKHGYQMSPGHEMVDGPNITSNTASTSRNTGRSSVTGEQNSNRSNGVSGSETLDSSIQHPADLTGVTIDRVNPVYFEVCIKNGRFSVGHFEIDITQTTTDGELFEKIWEIYNHNRWFGLRGWFLWPCDVQFVRFSIQPIKNPWYSAGIYDPPEYPPDVELQHRRYHYYTPKLEMPSNVFLHFLCSEKKSIHDHHADTWLQRLPKKLNDRILAEADPDSDVVFGWGVHILDGPNHTALSYLLASGLVITFTITCLVLGIAKTQEQAFGVGSFLIAIVVAIMSAVYFKLQDD